jgi:hypothetical protein
MDATLASALGIVKWVAIICGVVFLASWLDIKFHEFKQQRKSVDDMDYALKSIEEANGEAVLKGVKEK